MTSQDTHVEDGARVPPLGRLFRNGGGCAA